MRRIKAPERPSISRSDTTQKSMSYPNSIRLDPIRVPRPTILRKSPIFDVNDRNISTISSSRGVTQAHVTPSHGLFTFPHHLRTRRLDDIILDPVNGELVTDANQVTLTAQEECSDQLQTVQTVPRIIQRVSPPLQPTLETLVPATQMPIMNNGVSTANNKRAMNARALCSNPSLGYQRIMFIFAKYPALVIAIVALWNIEGHGKDMTKSTTEKCAFYSSLLTAAIVLVSQIILHTNHHYSYKKARIMSYLYHFVMVIAFCSAVTSTVFAVINFSDIRQRTDMDESVYANNNGSYYTNQERAVHQAILAGGSGMTILLALASFIYGGIGLNLMKRRLVDEYEKEVRLSAYENQAFQY
ncbi:hypothetical protein KIN20_014496 [Parelaphostrongylus tenuis]|uniref:Uncharacterized protein n=1 Tax=Parelaphostrongylus tenuis TaxID=148309 RepID=A0AAD5QLR7_PARTN|nr:hypothetical protein KIN20_014496 [Parelaphostrongylus tenuis]